MKRTSLTVGGFTQPSVAKQLFEQQASTDKGLTQRFLWIFPEPSFSDYATLEPVDKNFYNDTGKLYFFLIFGCPDKAELKIMSKLGFPYKCSSQNYVGHAWLHKINIGSYGHCFQTT